MEAMENINRRTGVTGSRGMGTLRKICKRKFFKKKTTIIETKNSLIGPITKSHIARGKINGP